MSAIHQVARIFKWSCLIPDYAFNASENIASEPISIVADWTKGTWRKYRIKQRSLSFRICAKGTYGLRQGLVSLIRQRRLRRFYIGHTAFRHCYIKIASEVRSRTMMLAVHVWHISSDDTLTNPYWKKYGMPAVNRDDLLSLSFPFPPTKAEQEAIAAALSDADALIESLEQLIAKKRHIKQGAMQELLTGQKRLPGFRGSAEVKQTGCLARSSVAASATPDDSEFAMVKLYTSARRHL